MVARYILAISSDKFFYYPLQVYFQGNNQEFLIWQRMSLGLNFYIVLLLLYLRIKCACLAILYVQATKPKNEILDSPTSNIWYQTKTLKDGHVAPGLCLHYVFEYKRLVAQERKLIKGQGSIIKLAQFYFIAAKYNTALFKLCSLRAFAQYSMHAFTCLIFRLAMNVENCLMNHFGNRRYD
jgi:hypothetical protein